MARRPLEPWKVTRLGPEQWMFHHSRCPARRHICFRGMLAGTLCGVRESWDLALRAARSRHAYETYEAWRVLDELAPPAGWPDRSPATTLQDTLP